MCAPSTLMIIIHNTVTPESLDYGLDDGALLTTIADAVKDM